MGGRWKEGTVENKEAVKGLVLDALKRGELEVVRISQCRIWLTDCPPGSECLNLNSGLLPPSCVTSGNLFILSETKTVAV